MGCILKLIRACSKPSSNIFVANTEWRTIINHLDIFFSSLCYQMNGRKSQGHRKDSEQGSGRITLKNSCSQIPLLYAPCGHSEVAKSKIILPEAHKGCLSSKSLLFLCQAGEDKRTDCVVVSTWVLENLIHPSQ